MCGTVCQLVGFETARHVELRRDPDVWRDEDTDRCQGAGGGAVNALLWNRRILGSDVRTDIRLPRSENPSANERLGRRAGSEREADENYSANYANRFDLYHPSPAVIVSAKARRHGVGM